MIVVFLCSFYLVNLILAIVAMSYDDCQRCEREEIEAEYAAALVCTDTSIHLNANSDLVQLLCTRTQKELPVHIAYRSRSL